MLTLVLLSIIMYMCKGGRMNNKLKEKRLKRKMTQAELSEKSGVSRYIISKLENGNDMNITRETMIAIADALDYKVNSIFLF